ncbi:hypothetical protein HN709_02825 [Candidatus Peregrinibacteria bacterium]|nr:hypothetical protein [Candidatus Peregrinibacteria bacterium]
MKKQKLYIWKSAHGFIYKKPPGLGETPPAEGEKPDEKPKTPVAPEKAADQPAKREELGADMAVEAVKITPEAVELNKLFHEKAKTYAEKIDKLPEKEARKLIEQAASKSMIELQGWEWLGLDEKSADQRHLKLGQAFLKKTVDQHGQEIFIVKAELDHSENTRMGIGAGHLLPPSVKAVEITDNQGIARKGVRKLINGQKAGYYDENGNYLAIFGGYKIRPLDFIDETGPEYKTQVEAEVEHYKNLKAIEETYGSSFGHIPGEESSSTAGLGSEYVSSLKNLEEATEENLKEQKASDVEITRILKSKEDWFRMKAICGNKGLSIRVHSASEAYGATHILGLEGKGAEILGWKPEQSKIQEDLTTKLTDKTYIEESLKDLKEGEEKKLPEGITIVKSKEEKDGYYFKDKHNLRVPLELWTARQAIQTLQLSETALFIKAMQSGKKYLGHNFIGNYSLDLAHLKYFHYLVEEEEGQKTLKEALEKVKKTNGSINPMDLIKYIETSSMPDEGLSIEEVIAYCKKNPNLSWMVDPNWQCKCCAKGHANFKYFLGKKVKPPIQNISYQWNKHKGTAFVGVMQCARTVSDILGLNGRYKSCTHNLTPALIQANLRKTGKTGIVFGMENFREGDVIMWRGSQRGPTRKKPGGGHENYGHNRFSHTGIVRHVMEIGGEKYIAMQHNSDRLYIELVSVSRRPHNLSRVKRALKTRSYEDLAQTSSDPDKLRRQFADIFGFRSRGLKRAGKRSKALVRVRFHKDDSKMLNGTFAFAIRTAHLQSTPGNPSPIE